MERPLGPLETLVRLGCRFQSVGARGALGATDATACLGHGFVSRFAARFAVDAPSAEAAEVGNAALAAAGPAYARLERALPNALIAITEASDCVPDAVRCGLLRAGELSPALRGALDDFHV